MKSRTIPSIPVTREMRRKLEYSDDRYDKRGRLRIRSPREARDLAAKLGKIEGGLLPSAADIYGAAWIITAWRLMVNHFGEGPDPYEPGAVKAINRIADPQARDALLTDIASSYPDDAVWHGRRTPGESALREVQPGGAKKRRSGRERTIKNWTLSCLAAEDPAFSDFLSLFRDPEFDASEAASEAWNTISAHDMKRPAREPEDAPPLATLRRPVEAAPDSVKDQLLYILTRWGSVLGDWAAGLVGALDMIEEERRPRFGGGPGPVQKPGFGDLDGAARFSDDHDWMPQVVMVAKNVLVWMDQLSRTYNREIRRLNQIPDEELDILASRGFNALWLIGLWERSSASREIKQRMGNPEAAASAYSLFGYDIDPSLGGWEALESLRGRAEYRGIRLSSDMVPNHVGIDSDWVRQHPEWLLAADECPYPAYGFNSDNLSGDDGIDIRLEDHYWDKSDAAVVFRRVDRSSGQTRYVYHGNDGTSMPWNDTAQIDFLNPEAREAVIRDILHVARNFPIIRFDAAMVLARKSIRRLWYPAPGSGGAIPSRSEYALTDAEFNEACPTEFWRDVVDRVAEEIPGTLLLAEAFWMMEGYFVRALGMHRVYNSAFMNMLRDGRNGEYRAMMKETLAFDPGILQRFVNFMNNPDEETAVEQFGRDDRYFATCTLLSTLPGLPMFGHGQIEGLSEKYGMEYVRAYRDEHPDPDLVARHEREIFPVLARRSLFAGATAFRLYDLINREGVNEEVYAFSNADAHGPVLVLVNNAFERANGVIHRSSPVNIGENHILNENLSEALVPRERGDGDWVLIRELLTGLWFIRSIGTLRNDGLSVAIDGYGRQLYVDFRYERETADEIWGRLAAELGGKGTSDPDEAIGEIRLRPIRAALEAIVTQEEIDGMARSITRGRAPKWPDREAEIAELIRIHREFTGMGRDADPTVLNARIRRRLRAAARHYRLFGGGLRRNADRRFPGRGDDGAFLALWCVLGTLTSLDGAGTASATQKAWGLDRWLLKSGMGERVRDAESRLRAAHAAEKALFAGRSPGETLSSLMSDSDFRKTCGVNTWNGVVWFDDEAWKRSVRALVLSSGSDDRNLLRQLLGNISLRRILRVWDKASAEARYHLEELLKRAR